MGPSRKMQHFHAREPVPSRGVWEVQPRRCLTFRARSQSCVANIISSRLIYTASALGKFLTCQHDKAVTRKRYESHEVKTMKNSFVGRGFPRKAAFPFSLRY